MRVFTLRSTTTTTTTTAVVVGIVSIVACLCVISSTTATIGFVHADSSVGQGNNHINNVQGQDSFLIGKDGPFDGSAVEEEGVEGGVGVRGVGIDSEPAGSIVLQPAAPVPATGPEQSVEDEDDLEGEVVGANREAMAGESTAESKKGMKKRPGTLNTHRNSKSKHRNHRGHGRGNLRGRYGKKKGVVHRDRNGQRPGGRDDKKQGDYEHRHGEYKVRKHGHKHHEKLRHHGAGHGQGGKKSPRVRNLVTRQLNLVCDGKIIDKVRCRRRSTSLPSHIHLEESPFPNPDNNTKGDDENFGGQLYALNTRKRIKQHYVFMSSPCSNARLPSRKNEAQGVLVRPLVSEANIDESLEYEAVDHVEEVDGEDDSDDDDDDEEDDDGGNVDDHEDLDESAVDGRLEAKNNDGRNHPHHEQNPGNQQPQKRPHHPYKDLCIAKGHFCGSRMFGCRFRRTTLYDCQAVGAKPLVRLVDTKVCGGSRGDNSGGNGTDPQDPCKCAPGTSATTIIPICGSQLPARCNIEPNAIYFCPHGPGSKFELLQICQPGTQCRARSNGADPICGASTCDCTGSNQLCAEQFPDNCPGISKNTAYKCSLNNGGKADMVKECASDQTCVSISGGTLCVSNDCTCPMDGTACGEIFPLRCRIPTTALYRCVKGEAPVLIQNCAPGRCSSAGSTAGSATAMTAGTVVFEGLVNNDCVDSCRCTSPGTVSGGTFPNYCKLEPNTLYTCTTPGSPPIPGEKCIAPKSKPPTSSPCIINGGDDSNPGHTDGDKGKPLTCSCKSVGGGILAGADLAPECHADPTVIYYCPKDGDGSQGGGSDNDPPVVLQQCPPGTISQSRPRPLEPQCGFSNCNCTTAITGNVAVCSDQFPLSCKLIPNSVYKCSASGVPEIVSTCSSSRACVPGQLNRAVCAASGTSENGCKCTEDGSVCGGAFPLSCGLSSSKVFNCKKGQTPIVHTDCRAGTTCLTTPSATLCVDSCACAVQGDVCGASFPPTCKLDASTIYKCTGAAANPIAGEKCAKGCTIQASADVCSHDGDGNEHNVCSCETVGVGNICGSDLPASCRAEANSIYICRDAKQLAPEVLSACHPGTLCKKRPFPAGAACSATSCNCTIDGEICSDNVRETCGLEPNTIYRCSSTGLLPTSVRKCDSSSTCVKYNDTTTCVSNSCICAEEGEVCGDAFPLSCKLKGSTVYTCAKGQAPVAKHDCGPLRCSAVVPSTGDRCVDPCSCERNDVVCGSTFPSTCNLNKNILYKCTGPGFTPIPTTLCGEGKCVANAGPDTCDGPGAHVDPPPSEICTCPVSSSPVCGKVLASTFCRKVMDIDPNLVYHCPGGPGTLPEIQQICQPGTICISQPEPIGAACGGTTCDCTGVTELCARAFKERCGLRPNSVYRCSASGIPKLVQKCTSKQVCVTESDGSQCVSNDCKCEVDGFTCGERFHLSCGFKGTALYNCTKGESPIFIKDFAPDRCASYKIVREAEPEELQAEAVPTGGGGEVPAQVSNYTAFDDALSDIDYMDMSACHCTKELAMVCGQSFPERCGYDRNEVYRCDGPNQEPVKAKLCPGTDSCVVNPGDDDCNDCKCTGPGDVCGRKFPESCAYNPDQLFSCPGGIGSDPIPSERCVENGCAEEESGNCHCGPRDPCRCTDRRHICGSTFSDECHFDPEHLYVCSRRGSLPTKLENCGFGCLKNYPAEADRCKTVPHEVVDCTCRDVTRVCGSAFPKDCDLDKEALFKCGFGKGSTPRFDEKCASGRCLVKEGADDVCMSDQCVCKDKKAVCGSSFPEECKLDADRIYSCPSSGATPIAGELCPEGCAAQNEPDSSDECKKPDCTCQKTGTLCGRSMQSGCNFSNQSIYDCTAGVGSTPVLQKLCVPGTTCQENAEGASCCGSKCTCTGNLSVCSNQFPDGCGLKKNAVYKCTPSGRLVLDKDCEGDQTCVSVVSGATCTSTDCKCTEDGQVCGRKFPQSCKLNGSSLYTCHAGDSPVLDKDCSPGYCDVPVHHSSPPTIECIDPCVCPSVDMMCGSTFSDACKLDAGSLYSCTSIGIAPVLAEKCMNDHCMTSMGPDSCGPIVEPPSRCFCNSTASICGSSLDLSCESVLGESVDASSIYTCSDDGQKPVKSTKCTMDEVCTEESNGAKCKSLCTCTGTDTKCSKDFPPACHLPEGVYKCGSDGKPQKDRDCLDLNICVDNMCILPECVCKNDNSRCGSTFPDKCGLEKNAVYVCVAGKAPLPPVGSCEKGTCSANVLPPDTTHSVSDFCIKECECKETSTTVCASTFAPICGLDSKALMSCSKLGDIPTLQENCTLACETKENAPDVCKFDPCACSAAGDVCGSSFPNTCTYEAQSIYSCKAAAVLPEKRAACAAKETCLKSPAGPVCTPEDCLCKDDNTHCGSTFVEACNLKKETLYKCVKGALPTADHDCAPGICSANIVASLAVFRAEASDSCIDQCACKEANVPVCGSVFDLSCTYKANDLMDCKNVGDVPTIKESCTALCTVQPGPDGCAFDPCACSKAGDTCGSAFPENCKYEKDAQYTCSGNKVLPIKKAHCPTANVCLVSATGSACTPLECICKDDANHCGSTFADSCKLESNMLYKCTSGTLPTVLKDCGTGTCSANVVAGTAAFKALADDKCIDQCACKEANVPVCASTFDSSCSYGIKPLLACGNTGDVPTVKENCTLSCTPQSGPDACTLDPCACTKAGDVCSKSFPDSCPLDKDTVYSCAGDKALPEKKDACAKATACLETPSGPTCTPPDCICKDDGSHCGSTFVALCNLKDNTLYKCTNGQLPTPVKDCGSGTCSTNVVKFKADFRATADDICIDQCACKEAGVPVCGGAFDSICAYDSKALMDCKNMADVPTVKENCTLSCDKKDGPDDCFLDPCACTAAGDTCSNTFPSTCPYEKDSVYTCEGPRKLPTKKETCPSPQVCLVTPTGPTCTPEDCICKDDGSHCGSTFLDSCKLEKNSLYKCKTGSLATLVKDCGAGTCSANVVKATAVFRATAEDICIDHCACIEANVVVCASAFDPLCNYKAKDLMECTMTGDVPNVKESCTASCTVQPGPDICAFDPCACTKSGDICSQTFPDTCGYEPETVLSCSGNKALPTEKAPCKSGTVCFTTPSGPTCTPPDCICKDDAVHCGSTFVDACNLQNNTLYKCTTGQPPNLEKDCGTGTCSANLIKSTLEFSAAADDTCIDQCACKEAGVPICAPTFDPICHYDSKALMDCANTGDIPTVKETCTLSCTEQPGPDECKSDPCACTKVGDACGSTLPSNCGYEKDSVYTCTAIKALPVKKSACESGKACLETPAGPTCTPSDCICKDDGSHCGSTFIDACNLQKNSLYKCTNGSLPALDKDCGAGICSANVVKGTSEFRATTDDKCLGQCACKEANVPICASAFDSVCNYKEKDLMACGQAGDIPTVTETCTLSCTKQPGPDVCAIDPCACTKAEETCGSIFPTSCNDEANSLYTCSANKALPVKKAACPAGNVCLVTATGSVCTLPECICTDDISHCGSTLPATCNLQDNTLYKCTKGSLPTLVKDCGTGTCSANVVAGAAAFASMAEDKCIDQCACKEANVPVCASVFDTSCSYGNKSLMDCGNAGDVPNVKEECTLSCTKQPGPDVCTFDPCACTKAGDACGSTLPPNCGYEKDSIYTCSSVKTLPVKKSGCESGKACLETSSGPTCTPPDCICKDDGSHCGSAFIDACNLQKNSLYKCTNGGLPSLVKDCGTGTCSANVVKGTAAFRATADDKCLDQCACKEAGIPVCGSAFDATCNYDTKVLMSCGEAGDIPAVAENCTLSCTKQPGADICTFDPCACTKAGDTCGSAFPETCNYEKDSQYSCSGNKALPVKKAPCPTSNVCLVTATGSVCTPPDCICKDDGPHCGSTFAASCNLIKNTLYKCTNGQIPTMVKDCGTGTCSANVVAGTAAFSAMADDKCLDLCACKEANVPVCASAFDASCGYGDKSLMDCGDAGNVPTVKEACTLSCTKQPGPDVCTFDPCACTKAGDACGSSLPPNCGYEKDSVYTCSAIKALPVKKSACESGKACLETPAGPTCTPPDCICKDDGSHCGSTFIDACNLLKNSLYKCTNGGLPALAKDCGTGTCSANVVKGTAEFRATADDKCLDQCACKEANVPICASAFDSVCNYKEKDLMACGQAGDVPTVTETCTLSCTKQPGPDVCALDPCACTKAGDTCGNTFPDFCGYDMNARYSCAGERKLPVKKDTCPTGNVCVKTGNLDPVCTSPDCICKDNDSHCGSRYPAICALKSETLYKCTLNALPVPVRDCAPGVCSANIVVGTAVFTAMAASDICVDQCACKVAGVPVCANAFSASCNYNNKALFTCAKVGDVPTVQEMCTKSCTAQPGPDVCSFDPCACTKAGDVCGNSLDPTCGYEKTSVYTCGGNKMLPTKKDSCPSGNICLETSSGPTCTPPDCVCKDDGSHCGSTFIPACKLVSNTLYKCTNGALPSSAKDCNPGTCSANVVAGLAVFKAMADDTCIDQCACKEANVPICASTFDPICNYGNKSLMACGNVGDVPTVKDACTLSCTKQPGPDVCTFDPCACTKVGDACGGTLPPNCGYEKDSVYTCSAIKALPVKKSGCESGKVCLEIPTGPACTPPDCICKDDEARCGSTFIDGCMLQKNSLYQCKTGGFPSLIKDCGTGTCSANVVKGTAAFRATADDKCLDQCACKEAGVPVCASAFDSTCNYNPKQLMDCGLAGDVPTVRETCTLSCTKQPGADMCAFDPCACNKAGNFCGSNLPAGCGYEAGTLYTCVPTATPVIAKNCLPGICSTNTTAASAGADGVDICIPLCACKKPGAIICASEFDASCPYDKKALLECGSIADVPKVKETCTLKCDTTPDPDECALDVCACSKAGDTCGSAFPDTCNYEKNSQYSCSANKALPVKKAACPGSQVCLVNATGSVCTPPECICKDDASHCGSTFAASCKLESNTLYKCTSETLPTILKDCGTGTCSANVVAGTAEFATMAEDKCIDQCACKEANVPVCASVFDPSCNYGNKSLMDCGNAGDVPTVKEACTLSCTKQLGPDVCTADPCACTTVGDMCGGTLRLGCSYKSDSIYTCSAIKALPVKKSACQDDYLCFETPAGPTCASIDCICQDDATHCGSTFSEECGLKSDTLYKCHDGSIASVAQDCALTGICSANIVLDSGSKIGPKAVDICVDKCACKEANVSVCASTFDASCNYDSKALLTCGNLGNVPTIQENCTASCEVKIGSDACALDPCACVKSGDTCGSAFPDTCNYEKNSQYTCSGNKALPVKKIACPASNVCLVTATGSVCTPPDCICKENADRCGSTFASSCSLVSNSLYKCTNGTLPALVKDCGTGTCSANVVKGTSVDFSAMANDICIDQCACKEAGVAVCGSVFSSTCAYNTKALMNCANVGDVPTVKETCTLSCTVQAGPDVCTFDPCACTTIGDVCGTAFPAKCNLKNTAIYSCSALKALPVKKVGCLGNAICFVQPAGPKCTLPDCICKDDNKHCGSAFFGACNMVSNTLYSCTTGALPIVVKDCSPGVCSGNVVSDASTAGADMNDTVVMADKPTDFKATAADEFCIDQCACKESEVLVCGSTFDAVCNYNASALMSCENVGDMPVLMNVCTKGCTTTPTTSECNFDPCACTVAGDTCGGSLPANCSYNPTAVYSCAGPSAAPVKKLECKSGSTCTTAAAGPTCTSLDCICKDSGLHCGSQFPNSCGYAMNTLYSCTTGLVPAVKKDCGDGTCSSNINSGKAEFMAAGDDFCVDKCACQVANVPVCASSFSADCKYDNKTLMSCGNQGDVPVVSDTCTSYCNVIPSAPDVCAFDPCACRRVGDTCGKSFPANCGYLPNSLYTCATNRALPVKKSDCQSSEICQMVPGGVDVCVANKVCDCVGTGTVCTDQFPADCARPANSVVTCPAETVTACPNGCAIGACQAAGCTCTDTNVRCGATFAPSCNLIPSALYTCVSGQAPVLKADCGAQACVLSGLNAVCQDPCKCRSTAATCGSAFPTSCGLSSGTLYNCTAVGVTPVLASVCVAGCYASLPQASCKKECATAVNAATAQISTVTAAMTALLLTNNLTQVVYAPLIATLNEVSANLAASKDDLTSLTMIAAPAGATVASALRLLTTAQVDFRTLNFVTSVALNSSIPDLQTLIQKVVSCANSNTADCTGILTMYRRVAAAATIKATQTPAPVTADMKSQLAAITTALEKTLTTGDTSTLRATGQTFGALIGKTAGNTVKYGDFSNSLLYMYEAFGEALKCQGVNVALFADKCTMYRDRLSGVLGDFIQFIQDNIGSFPVVGPLIITPLLAALKSLVIDLQTGIATAIGGTVALLYGILQIVNIVSPANQTNPIRDYLLRLVGLLDIPTECGGGGSNCTGLIQIVRMIANALLVQIAGIPVAGYLIASTLNPLIDGLFQALTSGTSAVIYASYTALNAALTTLAFVPYFGTISTPLQYMVNAIKQIADCLSTGSTTSSGATTVDKLELESGGVEKVELLGGDHQEQQPFMIEQFERILSEV